MRALSTMMLAVSLLLAVPFGEAISQARSGVAILSFDGAWDRMEHANPVLQAERMALEQARAGVDEAKGRRWPEITLSGNATRLPHDYGVSLDPLREVLAPIFPEIAAQVPDEFVVQPRSFSLASARAVWPVYAGGRIRAGESAARAQAAAGESTLEQRRADLALLLVQRYFGVSLAQQAVMVRQEALDTLRQHQDEARKYEAEGMIARAERLRADVAVAEAERDLSDARRDLALAQAGLAALLAVDAPVGVSQSIPGVAKPVPLAQWQRLARASNPGLVAAAHEQDRAEAGVRAARGEKRPEVYVFGQYALHQHDVSFVNPQHLTQWAVGVGLEWKLFDGGQMHGRVAAAQALVDEVRARYEDGARNLDLLVEQRYHTLLAAQDRLVSYAATRALAQESLRAQRVAFAEGMGRSLDVIDAELSLSRLRLGELDAHYEGLVALAGLHATVGDVSAIRRLGAAVPQEDSVP